jgi:DNA replication and repair protein RecF
VGTHKDDLSFEIDGHPIKKGSQGTEIFFYKTGSIWISKKQRKAHFIFDDIFDKLDESR